MENAISNLRIWGVENLRLENAIPPQIFHPQNSRFETAFSTANLPPTQIWGWKMLFSRISNFPPPQMGGRFGVENASRISNLGGGKFGVRKCYSNLRGGSNLGRKMLSRNFPNAVPPKILGHLENLGWKPLSRISRFGGVENLGFENAISKFFNLRWVENLGWKMLPSRIWRGGKFGAPNAISNLQFGDWKHLGWKMLLDPPIWGFEKIFYPKCYLESPIWDSRWKIWGGISRI